MARGHTFQEPSVKAEMLDLRRQGYSYVEIARKYKVDHSTIIYHCQIAGLAISRDMRDQVFALINQGIPENEVSERLKVPGTVVEFYCYRYGLNGAKLFGRTNLHLGPIAPRTPKISDQVTPTPKAILTRIDDRGVEWKDDGHGNWICLGRSEKHHKQYMADRKKRELEDKRLAMLTY